MLNFLINTAYAQTAPTGSIVNCGPGFPDHPTCGAPQFWELVHTLISYAIYIGIAAVGLSIVFAGVMFLTSAGSGEKTAAGKKAVTAAIVGLVITLSAWLIVNTIIQTLVPNCGNWYNFDTNKVCGK